MEKKKIYLRSNLRSQEYTEDSREISGLAVIYNSWSRDLGGYTERIIPGAITQELIDSSDVIANYNHNSDDYLLARSVNGKGTLKLSLEADGLHFSFDAPPTAKGDELLFHVRSGNITECSFAFTIPEDGDKYYQEGGTVKRDIMKIDGLYDISLVNLAAYPKTYCRDLDEAIRAKAEEINEKLDSIMSELEDYIIKLN